MSPGLTGARGPRAARRGSGEGGSSRAPRSGEARSWLVPDSVFSLPSAGAGAGAGAAPGLCEL